MYKVFLADDELWVTIGVKKLIEKTGLPFQVIGEAMNGIMALEAIIEKKPDVLITDIRMPGYDGLELAEQLKARQQDIKVILLSGYADFEYARKALRLGTFEYLLKPVKYEQLEETLQKLLDELESEGKVPEGSGLEEVNISVIREIVQEIQGNYTENITLTQLAERYNISVSHLSSLIKEELGVSYVDYITTKRIQKAKELLTASRLSVNEVGEEVGYKDYYYFNKVFKKITGITPSKYRKSF